MSQIPNVPSDPTIFIVWPNEVVTFSLNVMGTVVGRMQSVVEVLIPVVVVLVPVVVVVGPIVVIEVIVPVAVPEIEV